MMTQMSVASEDDASTNPEYDAWFQRKVEAGERAYREGHFISQEEESRRADVRRHMLLKMLAR